MTAPLFLPGVPEAYVRARMNQAGGDEIGSGKFAHPESSASLAANAFGWFVDRPMLLPSLPGTELAGPPERIEIEYNARFPWVGGRHPWLDAVVVTATHIIGVESKRFEPFRGRKNPKLSVAYDRSVWGDRMERYGIVRDALRSRALLYRHLDAAQLVKHAYGLVTEGRRIGRKPVLFYLYAEPTTRGEEPIREEDRERHRREIGDFTTRVAGDEVAFRTSSYRAWLSGARGAAQAHALALIAHFRP